MIHVYFKDDKLPKEWHRDKAITVAGVSGGKTHLGISPGYNHNKIDRGYLRINCHPSMLSIKYPGLIDFLKECSVESITTLNNKVGEVSVCIRGIHSAFHKKTGESLHTQVTAFKDSEVTWSVSSRCGTTVDRESYCNPVKIFVELWTVLTKSHPYLPDIDETIKWEESSI